MDRIRSVDSAAAFARSHRVWFCDVWGVVHDGLSAFPDAVSALQAHRAAGGYVVLLTNAPRPASSVAGQLEQLQVPASAYDAIVTSGDVTRQWLIEAKHRRILHIGPPRDHPFFDGLDIDFVGAAEADSIVCTGLFDDETEHPEDYRERFADYVALGLKLLCANPDRVVRRGDRLFHCAGVLADVYLDLGGEVVITGKPHAPIYAQAFATAAKLQARPVVASEVLVIGDGLATDLAGAASQGLAALFIVDGIHAEELGLVGGTLDETQSERIRTELRTRAPGLKCLGVMRQLRW
jgi:HAD superfamily hydrolase (TIGR01459 family)